MIYFVFVCYRFQYFQKNKYDIFEGWGGKGDVYVYV